MQELLIANNVVGIVSLVIAVYLIITFIGQARNISAIRRMSDTNDSAYLFEQARKYEFMRNKEKALEMYLNAVYVEVKERDLNGVEVGKIEDNLKQRYADKIKQLGGEWPDFSIFKSSI